MPASVQERGAALTGCTVVVGALFGPPSDTDGPDSELEKHLADANIIMSQPFFPAYLTAERIAKAPKLEMA
eukprot:gene7457-6983_t